MMTVVLDNFDLNRDNTVCVTRQDHDDVCICKGKH